MAQKRAGKGGLHPGGGAWLALPVAVTLLAPLTAVAAEPSPETGPRLALRGVDGSAAPVVRCRLAVLAPDGATVAGLTSSDFTVTELGRAVPVGSVTCTAPDGRGLAVVFAVDCSRSMGGPPLGAAVTACRAFLDRLSTADRAAVVAFSEDVGPETPISADHRAARTTLEGLVARAGTHLYDAVLRSVERVAEADEPRKAVLVVTDGRDSGSSAGEAECVARARREGVRVHCVAIGRGSGHAALRRLAAATGGALCSAGTTDVAADAYRAMVGPLRREYVLTYRSPVPQGEPTLRDVCVSVSSRGDVVRGSRQYVSLAAAPAVPPNHAGGTAGARWLPPALLGLALVDGALLAAVLARRARRSA